MTTLPSIPTHIETLQSIPERLRPLYELSDGDGWQLKPAGKVLVHYRSAVARDPVGLVLAPLTKLSRPEWMTLVGAATPGPEREHVLKSAASKRITVKG